MRADRARNIVSHVVLMFGVVLSIFPFYWMVVMASNTTSDFYRYPPKLTIGPHLLDNVRQLIDARA